MSARLRAAREQGVARSARIAIDRAALSVLRSRYPFHPWHATSPTSARPYRKGCAELVSGLKPRCVVEVGCGLGAILARVRADHRHGYDTDGAAIRAARLIRSRAINFVERGFEAVVQSPIDVLVAVNCLHDFAPEQVERWLAPLLSRTRYLLVDRVDRASPTPYEHYHDFAFLEGRASVVESHRFGETFRSFVLYEARR